MAPKQTWTKTEDGWVKDHTPLWTEDDLEAARKGLDEDSDIPRDDPDEDEPYMTKSERKRRGLK